jgi:hypothetical protein
MDRVAFSPNGKEFYYLQDDRWYSLLNAKVKMFRYDGHQWTGPTVLQKHFFAITLSPNGKTLYFEVDSPKHVWSSTRTNDGWTPPPLFLEEPFALYGFMPTLSGAYYKPGYNGDLYVAPDESHMIVSAQKKPSNECELYIFLSQVRSDMDCPGNPGT